MSLARTRPNEIRPPEFRELPDGRKRLTRFFGLANETNVTDALVDAYGTLDVGPATGTTAGFANLRLVDQRLDHDPLSRNPSQSVMVKVYEELPATAEQAVGNATKILLEDGRVGLEIESLQLVAGSYVPGTVGSTTAPGDSAAYLQEARCEDDGAVRKIKRTYVYAGTLSDSKDYKANDGLTLRTIVSVKTPPDTPNGYTLVSTATKSPNGLPVYTYQFAKGAGQISQEVDYGQSGDQGTTGVTRTTIRYLVAPGATVQPTSLSGSVLIGSSVSEADGHRVWTTVWAKGTGQLSQEVDYSQSGDQGTTGVTRTTIRYLVASGATVQPTTLTNSVQIGATWTEADGYRIWTTVWAKGTGEIGREEKYQPAQQGGTSGTTRTTIHYLVAPGASVQPTELTDSVLIGKSFSDSDGYRVWTTEWGKGSGHLMQGREYRNNGQLTLHRATWLGPNGPYIPAPAKEGAVTQVSYSFREEAGYRVWEVVWAEGIGEISREIDYGQSGDQGTTGVTRTTIRYLVAPEATVQPTSLSGSVLIGSSVSEADGHRVWTTVWAKGTGVIDTTTRVHEGGLKTITTVTLYAPGASVAALAATGLSRSVRLADGYTMVTDTLYDPTTVTSANSRQETTMRGDGSTANSFAWTSNNSASSNPYNVSSAGYKVARHVDNREGGLYALQEQWIKPPATQTTRRTISFGKAGTAGWDSTNGLRTMPGTNQTLLATITTEFSTNAATTAPYSVKQWPAYAFAGKTDQDLSVVQSQALSGILATGSVSLGNVTFAGYNFDVGVASIYGADPAAPPSGELTISVDADIYLVDMSGTVVYRNTTVVATPY